MLVSRLKARSESEAEVTKLLVLVPELCMMCGLTEDMRKDFRLMKDVADFTRNGGGRKAPRAQKRGRAKQFGGEVFIFSNRNTFLL